MLAHPAHSMMSTPSLHVEGEKETYSNHLGHHHNGIPLEQQGDTEANHILTERSEQENNKECARVSPELTIFSKIGPT